jgi:hypothetical protein
VPFFSLGGIELTEARRSLLTIGAFFMILVVAILLYVTGIIRDNLVAPVILVLFGSWIVGLALMRGSNTQKYARSTFGTISMGLILIAIGVAWYLAGFNWLYSVALILLVFGVIVIAEALKNK